MRLLEAEIPEEIGLFIQKTLLAYLTIETVNSRLEELTGIVGFFFNTGDLAQAKTELSHTSMLVEEHNTVEYGDFQTNDTLARQISSVLFDEGCRPTVVLEPTCGKGNLLMAALRQFPDLQRLYGVEVYKPYLYHCKFTLLAYYLKNPQAPKPVIHLFHANVFDVVFGKLIECGPNDELLVIGNPPWVTNAILGRLSSDNLPIKSNFKRLSGLDALTGKSNFDIAEFITIQLLTQFQHQRGYLALLVKSSVIRNIVYDQAKTGFTVGSLRKRVIDAKKEFNVSVDAALFTVQFNQSPAYTCLDSTFQESSRQQTEFGWIGSKFVSNKQLYEALSEFDGRSRYEWRQGLKHDCSGIMELEKTDGYFTSKIQAVVHLEADLVFPLYKSSDLQKPIIDSPRKYVIVPQKKVGQDTGYIRNRYPLTYQYLATYQQSFDDRKSSIYKGKPPFSIFGIGDYSFQPYKVAISALYKEAQFALLMPVDGKPAMVDDTCYFIGFDSVANALLALLVLNHQTTRHLLQTITFSDSKRVYTKDILGRLDMKALAESIGFSELSARCPDSLQPWMTVENWLQFLQGNENMTEPELSRQLSLF